MKHLTLLLVTLVLLLCSCGSEKFTREQKNYTLPDQYENIGKPGLVYIPHISGDFVTVFNPIGMKVEGKISGGKGPCSVLILQDGTKGYITNFSSGDVTVFDAKTNGHIITVKTQEHPADLLEIPGLNKVLVSHESQSTIDVINTIDNSVEALKETCTGKMYYLKNSGKIFVPQIFTPFIKIIDPATLHITSQIETGGRPMAMAFTSDEESGYLANYDSAEVAKIDIASGQIVFKIKNIPSPRGIAVSPDNSILAVTNVKDNTLTIIDALTDNVSKTIFGLSMPTDVIFTADGNYIIVCNQGSALISVIETKSLEIKDNVKVASNPITLFADYR